jgi:hypothetical protein
MLSGSKQRAKPPRSWGWFWGPLKPRVSCQIKDSEKFREMSLSDLQIVGVLVAKKARTITFNCTLGLFLFGIAYIVVFVK